MMREWRRDSEGIKNRSFCTEKITMPSLKRTKLFLDKPGLLENFTERSGRQSTWMHT
jgi:hypothetical protein